MNAQLSRKERRKMEREARAAEGFKPSAVEAPKLSYVKPITVNQAKVFKAWFSGQHVAIFGCAGTGKSFIASYLALNEREAKAAKKVLIVRSTVPSRDQGFLPGTDAEKLAVYEPPYRAIVDDLFGRHGTYNRLKDTHALEFVSTSYLRGSTYNDTIFVVDEVQNMTMEELDTVMTRVGQNSRVILMGDNKWQNDLKAKRQVSCVDHCRAIVDRIPGFTVVEMGVGDIVRSGFVKDWIVAREAGNE